MERSPRPLRVLSLDGGGVRGLSILYILQHLMVTLDEIADEAIPRPLLPCQYFDLIGGTSTGGLIAVMLGTLRMDVETCIEEYIKLAPQIFPDETPINQTKIVKLVKLILGKNRYSQAPLESAVKRLVCEHLGDKATNGADTLFTFEASRDKALPECKVFVCAVDDAGKPLLFRSYRSTRDAIVAKVPIWQACLATSAAPGIFGPMTIGATSNRYFDGGIGNNNPIRLLIREKEDLWPSRDIGCIVSIGTGIPRSSEWGKGIDKTIKACKAQTTESEATARGFYDEMKAKYGPDQKVYYRFNVRQDLGNVELEEWKLFDIIHSRTRYYLDEERSQLNACASQLLSPIIQNNSHDLANTLWEFIPVCEDEIEEFERTKDSTQLKSWKTGNLRRAIETGDKTLVSELLSQGVQLNVEGLFASLTALNLAIDKGNIAIIELLLDHGADIEHKTMFRDCTPLLYAVELEIEQPEVASLLINRGANVDAKNREGMTALNIAAELGHAKIAQLLVGRVDIEIRTAQFPTSETPLSIATKNRNADLIKILLRGGARTEYQDSNGPESPLLYASEKGYESIVQLLLGSGALTTARQWKNPKSLPIHLAAINDHSRVVKLLLNYGADIRATNYYGENSLHLAAANNSVNVIRVLCQRGIDIKEVYDSQGRSPLLSAADKGHDASVKCLLENGANIESKDCKGNTALDLAFYNKHESVSILLLQKGADIRSLNSLTINPALISAASSGQAALVRSLLEMGVSLAETDATGHTALHHAAQSGRKDILDIILGEGNVIDVDKKSSSGRTPLHYAAQSGHVECLKVLLISGADVHAIDNRGQTCLHLASENGHESVVSLLVDKGVKFNAKDFAGQTCLQIASKQSNTNIVEFVLQRGIDIDSDDLGSALCIASSNGHEPYVRLLLDEGANVDGPPGIPFQDSPLFRAISNGHDSIVVLLLKHDADPITSYSLTEYTVRDAAIFSGKWTMVQKFLGPLIDIFERDSYGQTLLHKAALHGHQAIVQLLIDSGASLGALTKLRWLPIHGAALNGHREVLLLLLRKGSDLGSLQDMFQENLQKLYDTNPTALLRLFTDHANDWKALQAAVLKKEITAITALQLHLTRGGVITFSGKNGQGVTVLHSAAEAGDERIVQLLMNLEQFDINSQLIDGRTALHVATSFGHTAVVEILLNHGATLNCVDFYGNTALHYAVFNGHEETARTLIKKGINLNIEGTRGRTALQVAEAKKWSNMTALLSNQPSN